MSNENTCPICGADDTLYVRPASPDRDEADIVACEGCDWQSPLTPEGAKALGTPDRGVHDFKFSVGQRVSFGFGEGTVEKLVTEPGSKPYQVKRDDGTVAYFHEDQIGSVNAEPTLPAEHELTWRGFKIDGMPTDDDPEYFGVWANSDPVGTIRTRGQGGKYMAEAWFGSDLFSDSFDSLDEAMIGLTAHAYKIDPESEPEVRFPGETDAAFAQRIATADALDTPDRGDLAASRETSVFLTPPYGMPRQSESSRDDVIAGLRRCGDARAVLAHLSADLTVQTAAWSEAARAAGVSENLIAHLLG